MTKQHAPRHRLTALPEFQRAMHGLGSSNATQPHVPTPKKGTRSERVRQSIREQL